MRHVSALGLALLFGLCAGMVSVAAAQSTTEMIAYQGRISDSGGATLGEGFATMSFALYAAPVGGTPLWSETQSDVPVVGGLFTVALGSQTPFDAALFANHPSLWLEIAVDVAGDGLDPGDVYAPRTPMNSVPTAFRAREAQGLRGPSYVTVQTTEDPVQNGGNLLAAYAEARAFTPHGFPLAPDNRAVVIVPPGRYDLGDGTLVLDTDFVDLVGLTTDRDSQYIVGEAGVPGSGVVAQTANDVRIENLTLHCVRGTGGEPNVYAYAPEADLPATRVTNCVFKADDVNAYSMRLGVEYSGEYVDCEAGALAFGFGFGGEASGVFRRCRAGNSSFGGAAPATGTFEDCVAGINSFGAGSGAMGTFLRCVGGDYSFGGYTNFGSAAGRFVQCRGGDFAFGGNGGTASGEFIDCVAGEVAFGGGGSLFGASGQASGRFVNCVAGAESFGGGVFGSTFGGRFFACRMTGPWTGTFAGRMESCQWGSGLLLGNSARLYSSSIPGNVNLDNSTAGVAHCRIQGAILNAGSASFLTSNVVSAQAN